MGRPLTSYEKSALESFKGMYNSCISLENDQNHVFSYGVSSGITSGVTGFTSTGAFASILPESNNQVPWNLIAHETAHLTQYQNGTLVADPNNNGNNKNKEFEAYRQGYIAQYGAQYFENQAYYDNQIKTTIDSSSLYSGLSWQPSTGTSPDPGDPGQPVLIAADPYTLGSTGIINEENWNGDTVYNFYYFDDTQAQYQYANGSGMIGDPSGTHTGYNTGYKNWNTGEVTFVGGDQTGDENKYLMPSTGGDSTGGGSAGG